MPDSHDLKKDILEEVHRSRLTVHPSGIKMYKDVQRNFWWNGMKREVAEFVSKCLICQQVKAEHHKSEALFQPLPISEKKWENIIMDFVVGLLRS